MPEKTRLFIVDHLLMSIVRGGFRGRPEYKARGAVCKGGLA